MRPVIAAKILGLSEKTVRAWAAAGPLAARQGSSRIEYRPLPKDDPTRGRPVINRAAARRSLGAFAMGIGAQNAAPLLGTVDAIDSARIGQVVSLVEADEITLIA